MSTRAAEAIIAAVRPGVTLRELTEVAYDAIPDEEEPYMQTPSFFGHHIGLSSGDPALLDEPLAPGMVFTVEPWYYNHGIGVSVFVEEVILVTENGAEVLTAALPRDPDALEALVPWREQASPATGRPILPAPPSLPAARRDSCRRRISCPAADPSLRSRSPALGAASTRRRPLEARDPYAPQFR